MKNKPTKEIILSLTLVVLAVLLLNPFHLWMPDLVGMCVLAVVLVLFGIFAGFIVREKIIDERDSVHRTLAGRNAFLVGMVILMAGITIQEFAHTLDPWLVITLIAMIIVKIATRVWSDKNY